jgi:hypothetical protein
MTPPLPDKPKKPSHIETMALRPFRRERRKPVVLFAVEGLGMGWGLIDYRYRELCFRLDAEKGYAVGFVSHSVDFSQSWYLHDVAQVVTGDPPGYLSAQELSALILRRYDAIWAAISSESGRARIAAIQSPHFQAWATESAGWRDPAEQSAITVQIEDARRSQRIVWKPKYGDWALIALLGPAVLGLLAYYYLWRP